MGALRKPAEGSAGVYDCGVSDSLCVAGRARFGLPPRRALHLVRWVFSLGASSWPYNPHLRQVPLPSLREEAARRLQERAGQVRSLRADKAVVVNLAAGRGLGHFATFKFANS